MKKEPEHERDGAPRHGEDSPAPGRDLLDFLSGDLHEIPPSIRRLASRDPGQLRIVLGRLHRLIEPDEERDDLCADMAASLPSYLALGAQGPARMPEVYEHVSHCRSCLRDLEVLREAGGERSRWSELARALEQSQQEASIIWWGDNWHLAAAGGSRRLSAEDFRGRLQVGDWFLDPGPSSRQEMITLGPSITLPLFLRLPGNTGQIHLEVHKDYDAARQQQRWRIACRLDAASTVEFVNVGVGTADRMATGNLQLHKGKAIDFILFEPPVKQDYWVYFEWLGPGRAWHRQKNRLPVLSKRESERP